MAPVAARRGTLVGVYNWWAYLGRLDSSGTSPEAHLLFIEFIWAEGLERLTGGKTPKLGISDKEISVHANRASF